jgi:hypothetical protein
MPPRSDVACSNAEAANRGELALKTMTALLITIAATMILVRAAGWADLPFNDLDLVVIMQ